MINSLGIFFYLGCWPSWKALCFSLGFSVVRGSRKAQKQRREKAAWNGQGKGLMSVHASPKKGSKAFSLDSVRSSVAVLQKSGRRVCRSGRVCRFISLSQLLYGYRDNWDVDVHYGRPTLQVQLFSSKKK